MSSSPSQSDRLDTLFAALAHPARRGMVATLALRPATIGQLAKKHQVSLPAIHKHILTLETAQLLQRKKVGRTNFVALNRTGLRRAQEWIGGFRPEWGSDKETLENYIQHLNQ